MNGKFQVTPVTSFTVSLEDKHTYSIAMLCWSCVMFFSRFAMIPTWIVVTRKMTSLEFCLTIMFFLHKR